MRLDPLVQRCAEAMAGELDEAGYLRTEDAELASRLGVPASVIAAARRAVQACEPTGIGARDLAECLALQLGERNRLDPAMQALLDRLADLPTTSAASMAQCCGVDQADFADMVAELRTLDPRPGLQHGGGTAAPVVPDVVVRAAADGWRIALNPASLPRLLVDETYAARLSHVRDRETRSFLATCSQNASWLRRSLDQRARTILVVATEIARVQGGFFTHGVSALRPLTLRAVADAVGVHESTVSRVTSNKFMATPRGLFELKFFFGGGIVGEEGGEAIAAQVIRERIRALVAAEPVGKPLSDDQLVRHLKAEGIDVARRTVAKYREALHIASSIERRRRAGAAV
jgi:RNA polymerase sigma-54 factor